MPFDGPQLAVPDPAGDGRFYRWDNQIVNKPELPDAREGFPSVTTILSMMHKPALAPWAAKLVATYAVETVDRWHPIVSEKKEEVIKQLKSRPTKERDYKAHRGSAIHDLLELTYGDGMPVAEAFRSLVGDPKYAGFKNANLDEVVRPLIKFFKENVAEMLFAEGTAYSIRHQYAGSFDAMVRMADGKIAIIDYKTGKNVYSSNALQLQAYSMCEKIAVPLKHDDERRRQHIADNGLEEDAYVVELQDLPMADYGIIIHLPGAQKSLVHHVEFSKLREKCVIGLRDLYEFDRTTRYGTWATHIEEFTSSGYDIS